MRRKITSLVAVAALVEILSGTALAHPGHLGHGFGDGLFHPLLGFDHLLAMVAVGLLAARLGGRAVWMLPAVFMTAMLLGGSLAVAGIGLPVVEYGIIASVLVFGWMVARRDPLSPGGSLALVASFALFHGHAHAAEMAADGSFALYAAGFLLSTGLLHAGGVVTALVLSRAWKIDGVRLCGAAISAASLMLLLG
jgi:urease accessory protein